MAKHLGPQLSKRERQIMDIVYLRGEATVAQVREDLPEAPSYSAVRALGSVSKLMVMADSSRCHVETH